MICILQVAIAISVSQVHIELLSPHIYTYFTTSALVDVHCHDQEISNIKIIGEIRLHPVVHLHIHENIFAQTISSET
jgi:hypothetical protein